MALIHPDYLTEESMQQLRKEFAADTKFPSVACKDFLVAASYHELQKHMQRLKFQREERPGSHCFGQADVSPSVKKLLVSTELLEFLERLLGVNVQRVSWRAHAFQWKDYWLLPEKTEAAGVDIVMDISKGWNEDAGGLLVYRDAAGNFRKLPALGNMLAIVERKTGVQRYVQYLNCYAGKNKRNFLLGGFAKSL